MLGYFVVVQPDVELDLTAVGFLEQILTTDAEFFGVQGNRSPLGTDDITGHAPKYCRNNSTRIGRCKHFSGTGVRKQYHQLPSRTSVARFRNLQEKLWFVISRRATASNLACDSRPSRLRAVIVDPVISTPSDASDGRIRENLFLPHGGGVAVQVLHYLSLSGFNFLNCICGIHNPSGLGILREGLAAVIASYLSESASGAAPLKASSSTVSGLCSCQFADLPTCAIAATILGSCWCCFIDKSMCCSSFLRLSF